MGRTRKSPMERVTGYMFPMEYLMGALYHGIHNRITVGLGILWGLIRLAMGCFMGYRMGHPVGGIPPWHVLREINILREVT